MNIIVLNGSPKGKISATMQSVKFIQKEFPQHILKIINISQKLPKIEIFIDYLQVAFFNLGYIQYIVQNHQKIVCGVR